MYALNEAFGSCEQLNGPETEAKQTPVCKIDPSQPQVSHRHTWLARKVDSRCFLCEKERRTPTNDFGLLPFLHPLPGTDLITEKGPSEIESIGEEFTSFKAACAFRLCRRRCVFPQGCARADGSCGD